MFNGLVFLILTSSFLVAQTAPPERTVGGNVITSRNDPQARIELPKSAQYVGADRWILYDIADCELHAFVDTDGRKNVQRLYGSSSKATFLRNRTCTTHMIRRGTPTSATWISM